jgi:hypothetical protein
LDELKHDTILYAKQVMAEMGGEALMNLRTDMWNPTLRRMPDYWLWPR